MGVSISVSVLDSGENFSIYPTNYYDGNNYCQTFYSEIYHLEYTKVAFYASVAGEFRHVSRVISSDFSFRCHLFATKVTEEHVEVSAATDG